MVRKGVRKFGRHLGKKERQVQAPQLSHLRLAILAALSLGAGPVLAGAPNQIVIDGLTDTRISTEGNLTHIRTNTVRGNNAFNSFYHFVLAQGNTANLYLPTGSQNLINLVHDSRAVINGTLNGVLDGKLGGHIVFADPHGVVVGSQGVLNVGSLLLSAPNATFMGRLLGVGGQIDEEAVRQLLAGEAPLSSNGQISVQGRVNAASSILVSGADVAISGMLASASPAAQAALFDASVNTAGVTLGAAVSDTGGTISITAINDVEVSGELQAASAPSFSGRITLVSGNDIQVAATGKLNASGVGQEADGGTIKLRAGRDLTLEAGASLSAAGAKTGGDGGVIDTFANRDASVAQGVKFNAAAGATGDGGFIEVSAAKNVNLDGLNANLGAGVGGQAGRFLIDPVTVNAGSTAYYTNGGSVTIIASDSITLAENAVINTRHVEAGGHYDVLTGELGNPSQNPAGMSNPTAANSVNTASLGASGNVTLQAPKIEVGKNAQINTFATDGYAAGNITLESGDNVTCNICKTSVQGYFDNITEIGTPLTAASTDDVSIIVAEGARLDAQYRDRVGYTGAAGTDGDITLKAEASDLQVGGFSMAGAKVLVNGALLGGNISVTASSAAGVDFSWLASLFNPNNPTAPLALLEQISNVDVSTFHQSVVENMDDWGDVTNIAGVLGLPVTAGVAIADAKVEIGDHAILNATGDITVDSSATRSVKGGSGGLLAGVTEKLGFSTLYGHLGGKTSALITGGAQVNAGGDFTVNATSQNEMELEAQSMVSQPKAGHPTKGQTSLAFSAAIGYVDVSTEAKVDSTVNLQDAAAVKVVSTNLDQFTIESSSAAQTATSGATSKSQAGVSFAISLWDSSALASFDAKMAPGVEVDSLDVVADNIAETHVTKSTVQTGNNLFDYLLGTKANRQTAIDGLLSGALGKAGGAGAPKFAAAAAITVSEQTAKARIGDNAVVQAAGDVTVRSRVIDQGIRSIADSRVNSTGPGAASISGSVAFAYGQYKHNSDAEVGDNAIINANHIGIGADTLLPIDNDYEEIISDFKVNEWDGPSEFFTALDTVINAVLQPDVPAMESFGLADYLLTGYSNAYGDAESDGSAIFGAANALTVTQNTRSWVGAGAQLTANAGAGVWQSDFAINLDQDTVDDLDISAPTTWDWNSPITVSAHNTTETFGITGNLSLLTILTNRNSPPGKGVGGSFGWNQFTTNTIAGIDDGAVINANALTVDATTIDRMLVIAPSAGQGKSMAGNGIFSYAEIEGKTHASINDGARINANTINVLANHSINLWAIGGALAVSDETAMGAAVAVNSISTDTRAFVGNNSLDRIPTAAEDADKDGKADAPAANVAVADGSVAGLNTQNLTVKARSEGRVGAVAVAAAATRPGGSAGGGAIGGGKGKTATPPKTGGKTTPQQSNSSLSAAGSGTLNFSRIHTIAEVHDANFIVNGSLPQVNVSALTHVDQVSGSGSAAVSIGGGQSGRSTAIAGAVAYNDIDQETRAGLYNISLSGTRAEIGDVNVLAASYGDVLSIGIALAAASGQQSSGAALSGSYGSIDADTTAEIENSDLKTSENKNISVLGYDHSRVMVGGGALYLGLSGQGSGGVGLAASIGHIDNDVSAYVRGSTLLGFNSLDVQALGASRIVAAAFGGAVNTGAAPSGAGSFYLILQESDISSGITGSYAMVDHDADPDTPDVPNYNLVLKRSQVDTATGVNVVAKSTNGLAALDSTITEGGFDSQVDFDGDAFQSIDSNQAGVDPYASGLSGEAVLGFAGSLAVSSGSAAAGFAVGYTDLRGSYVAEVRDADVTADNGDINVQALNGRKAISVAVGASASSGGAFTALGSVAHTYSSTKVNAQVLGDSTLDADHVGVVAAADGAIYSLAGSLSVNASGSSAVGGAATNNEIGGEVVARLGGNSVIVDGNEPAGDKAQVDVLARQDADIMTAAVAAAATGGAAAVSGSVTTNKLTTKTNSILEADQVTANSVRVATLNGTPADKNSIMSLAGSITASANAGFGAAVAVNQSEREFGANVNGTTFNGTTDLVVQSTGASAVKTLAASGGAGGSVSAGASNASSIGTNKISAKITDSHLNSAARVEVLATDGSTIDSLAGAVQAGGSGAVGVATAVNDLGTTLNAGVSGGSMDVTNLLVQGRSMTDIDTVAVGVSVGGSAGVSGSIVVNRINSSTKAAIDSGAIIHADHNVGVLASSDDSINLGAGAIGISGATVGGAGSVTVNILEGETEAAIRGSNTVVVANANDNNDRVATTGGQLASNPTGNPFADFFSDGSSVDKPETSDFAGYVAPDLIGKQGSATGVVVDALALQQTSSVIATAGISADFVSGVGIAAAVNTTVMGGSARALVEDATIGDTTNSTAAGDLTLAAGHHAYGTEVMLGAAASSVGVVAAAGVSTYSGEATAAIRDANVKIGGDINVDAFSRRDQLSVIAGVAVGSWAGVSGSGAVSVFSGNTNAEVTGNSDIRANSLDLDADSASQQDLVVIGLAGSAGVAGAGTVAVAVSESDTKARIGDGNGAPQVVTTHDVSVKADNRTELNTVSASAALASGMGTAIAGAIGVQYIGNSTEASIRGADVTAGGKLDVLATDTLDSDAVAGSASVGGSAGAIGVNIGVIKSATLAQIKDSDVITGGAVRVDATRSANLEMDSVVASGSYSLGVSLSGGLGVLLFGGSLDNHVHDDAEGGLDSELGSSGGNWIGKSDSFASEDHLSTKDDNGTTVDRTNGAVGTLRPGANAHPSAQRFSNVQTAVYGVGDDGVEANISGGTIKAGDYSRQVNSQTLQAGSQQVSVKATDNLRTRNEAIAVSIGGLVSGGAGVAVTQVNSDVLAQAAANQLKASQLTVAATSQNGLNDNGQTDNAVRTAGYAGAAGIVGIGAAVGVGKLNGAVHSSIGGDIKVRDGVAVNANDTTSADVDALGASFGLAGAVGIAVAVADRDASISATAADNTQIQVVGDNAAPLSGVSLISTALGRANAEAFAAAGGLLFAGNGSVAVASDDRSVKAGVGSNSRIASRGDLTIQARTLPDVSAKAAGGAISYSVSVGASVARASSNTDLDTYVGDNSLLMFGRDNSAGKLLISAEQHADNSAGDWAAGYDHASVRADAITVNGSALLSVNGSSAETYDDGSVSTRVGDGVIISHETGNSGVPAGSQVTVAAKREAALLAKSTGVVAGLAAVGASIAKAKSDASTDAYFGGSLAFQAEKFALNADSVTDVVADATAGSGGVVAGAAANTEVLDDADTGVTIGGAGLIRADQVDVLAHHLSRFRPASDSVQAAVVGFSGSFAEANINSNVFTQINDAVDLANNGRTRIMGYKVSVGSDSDIDQGTNIVDAPSRSGSVSAGAGGVVNGSAGDSVINMTKNSRVTIGDGAFMRAYNRPDATEHTGLASLAILAGGSTTVVDQANLASGGAVQAPYSSSKVKLTGGNKVDIGDKVELVSADLLGVSAYETQVYVGANATTKTWGGVGFAGSKAVTNVDFTQQVNVGDDSRLQGLGNVFVTAGRRADTVSTLASTLFNVSATSDTYNYTALPLDTSIHGEANLNAASNVRVGDGTQLISGWNMTLGGDKGVQSVSGKGTGHNPYLELFSTETTERDETVTSSTSLKMDGHAIAGYFNKWKFNIAPDGSRVDVFLNGQTPDPTRPGEDINAYLDLMTFNPQGYVNTLNQQVVNLGDAYRAFAEKISNISGLPTNARIVRVHDVTATQGNVSVLGDALSGSGELEARGGARIEVSNPSTAWVDVANLNVIDNAGGRVVFLGGITSSTAGGVNIREVDADLTPSIEVMASGNSNQSNADQQPGLMVSAPLYNQRGLVRLYNRNGNIYQGSLIQATQVQVVAPNGSVVLIAPGDTIQVGGTPWSAWGANEFSVSANDVIAYALYDSTKKTSQGALEDYLYRNNGLYATDSHYTEDDGNHSDRYGTTIVPYNSGNLTGNSGSDGGYVLFDDEYRNAKFDHVPYKALSKTAGYDASQHTTAASSGIRANRVLILSGVLDINAPIVAGQETDITIDLNNTVKNRIDNWKVSGSGDRMPLVWYHESGVYAELPAQWRTMLGLPDKASANAAGWYELAPGQNLPFSADRTVSGYYDRDSNKLVMNGVQGATTGYIAIDAKIISTNQVGKLEVLNGYSDVAINNTTGYQLELNDVSTGTATTGVIELTDRLKNIRTWYVDRVGEATRKFETTNLNAESWMSAGVRESFSGITSYQPKQGTRFWWERKYQAKRSINSNDFFSGTATPWEFTDGNWNTGTTGVYDGDITRSGICTYDCAYNGGADFNQFVKNSWWGGSYSTLYTFSFSESVHNWGNVDSSSGHKHKFEWPRYAYMTTQTSVRADYPIQIAFSGDSFGSINVNSNTGVDLNGRLTSIAGGVDFNITGALTAADQALISAKNVDLSSSGNSIGAVNAPIKVNLLGNSLSASAANNVYVTAPAGNLLVGSVSGGGQVGLAASQSILSGAGLAVSGSSVSLNAASGRIGRSSGGAMQVNGGDRLDAFAMNNIELTQANGDMALGQVKSLTGDVTLTANNGSIVSATNLNLNEKIPLTQLRQYWDNLGITGSGAGDDASAAISVYEKMVEREYRRYWQFAQVLNHAADGSVSVTAEGQRLYSGIAAANGVSVDSYVTAEYQRLNNFFKDTFETTDLSGVSGFAAYDNAWQYTASAARQATFQQGAIWDVKQLENAINLGAVNNGGGGVSWLDDTTNVSGRNVTLTASTDVGGFSQHQFRLGNGYTITDQQRVWLLSAAPGGLTLNDVAGSPDVVDIDVRTLSRLRVAAKAGLSVAAGGAGVGNIFVGADGNANIERLQSSGEVYIGAEDNITYTNTAQVLSGIDQGLVMKAVNGSIKGANGGTFDLGINGTLTAAIAGTSMNLRDVGGVSGLDVGILYAQDKLAVHVPGDLRQEQGRGFLIGASSLELDVGGSAGTVGAGTTGFAGPLHISMASPKEGVPALDGTIFGNVGGSLYMDSASRDVTLAGNTVLDEDGKSVNRQLNVGDKLVLTSGGDVTLAGNVQAGGDVSLQSTGTLSLGQQAKLGSTAGNITLVADNLAMATPATVTATAGRIDIQSSQNAVVGLLTSGLNDLSSSAAAITITAGGNILSARGSQQANAVTSAAQGVDLTAGNDVGLLSSPFVVDAPHFNAQAGKNIYVLALRDATSDTIAATAGQIVLTGKGALTLDQLQAGTELRVNAASNLVIGTASSTDQMNLVSGANLQATTLNSAQAGIQAVATGSLSVDTAESALDQRYTSQANMVLTDVLSHQGAITAQTAGNLSNNSSEANTTITFDAVGSIDINDHATAGTAIDLNAGTDLRFGTLTAGDTVETTAGASTQGQIVDATNDINMSAVTNMTLAQVTSHNGQVALLALGNLTVNQVESQGDQQLNSGLNTTLNQLTSHAGNIDVNAARGTLTVTDNMFAEDGHVHANAGGSILVTHAITAGGGDILLDAKGNIRFETLDATDAIKSRSRGTTTGDLVKAGEAIDMLSSGDMDLQHVFSVNREVTLRSLNNLLVDLLESPRHQQLNAGGNMTIGTATSGATQTLQVGGNLVFNQLNAQDWITSASRGDTTGNEAVSVVGINMVAGQRADGQVAGGNLQVTRMEAPQMILRAGNQLYITDIYNVMQLSLQGDQIKSNVHVLPGSNLTSLFTGSNGGLADSVDLTITAQGGVNFSQGYARQAHISTTGNSMSVADGWITESMLWNTQSTHLVMDNVNPATQQVDMQLHEQDHRFTLDLTGQKATTDAYVTHYGLGWEVALPNYSQSHGSQGMWVGGPSAQRDSDALMVLLNTMIPQANFNWLPTVSSPFGGFPVNLRVSTDDNTKDDDEPPVKI